MSRGHDADLDDALLDEYAAHDWHPVPYEDAFKDIADAVNEPPKWVVKDLLPVGLIFVAGPPKDSRKSTFTMIVSCLSAGYDVRALPAHMREVENGGPVMAFSYEATAGELKDMVENGIGVKLRPDAGILIADDPWKFRLDDEHGMEQLLYWLNGRRPRIAILDPLVDFHAVDEKDAGAMNRLLRPLQKWAKDNDAAVIVVHHTRKQGEERRDYTAMDMRGASSLFGIADGVLMLTPEDPEKQVIKIHATFKRGQGWKRVVNLAIYNMRDRKASEVLDQFTLKVLKAYESGCETVREVAAQCNFSKEKALDCVHVLERNGLLVKKGKKWVVAR